MTILAQPITGRTRSTDKPYDLAVYIGRFQPFHNGHLSVVRQALEKAEKVLILVGSANLARDTRNPFTYAERATLIKAALHDLAVTRTCETSSDPAHVDNWDEMLNRRVIVRPLNDSPYDKTAWMSAVRFAVKEATAPLRPRVCLTGHVKDSTSEYLDWFQTWEYVPATVENDFNATGVRNALFDGDTDFDRDGWKDQGVDWKDVCPRSTRAFLSDFRESATYRYLVEQRAAETAYKQQWGEGPFQTVDAVVVKGDHVLMIERGGPEGTGMAALPGGFLNRYERLLNGTVREAVEETGLFIPTKFHAAFKAHLGALKHKPDMPEPEFLTQAFRTLHSYQRGGGVRFDDPHRSRRGHLITEAFLFVLPDSHGLPPVFGWDDAKAAFWMPISEVRPDNSFEDHAFIIDKILNLHG